VVRYDAAGHLAELGPLGYHLILAGFGAASYVAGIAIFCRRDLPAPL
jgi:hypothetical protein